VIGGGFAGLAAATALAEAGMAVRLFEARPSLGGRANTFRDPVTGERIDNGQHVLAGCYAETLAFLTRIGSKHLLHWPSGLSVAMVGEDGRRTNLRLPPLPPPFDLMAAIFAWDALSAADRWSILRVGRGLRGLTRVRPDETVRQWLERHGQSPRLCRLLWEPLALAALNQSIDQAAATYFVAVTSRMFGGGHDDAALLLPAVPLDELYARPAQRYLEHHGCRVTTHAKAALTFTGNCVDGVRIGDEYTPARVVIAAVPWFALPELLPSPPEVLQPIVANAQAMESAPIVTVNLWFAGPVAEEPFVGLPGRTFQWVFDRRTMIGSTEREPAASPSDSHQRAGGHLSLVCSGAEAISRKPSNELIATARHELGDALPGVRSARLLHAQVVRERRATFSLQPGGPQRPGTVTPAKGLLLAGDWIDTGLPATIESAVESGHRAAAQAIACLR
jgi:squalene-associated FAD-dependent desaturase